MIRDLESLPPGETLECDVCLLGGGIAGLLLAKRLSEAKHLSVVLLEAGGIDLEQRSQSLYAMENAGLPHPGTTEGRFRVLGGSSTRWGGQLLPLSPYDFEPRPHVPWSGWPIALGDVEPYLPAALEVMGVDDLPFDASFFERVGASQPPFDASGFDLRWSKWAPFGKRNLARTVGKEIAAGGRVRCLVHANVLGLSFRDGAVDRARVADYTGAVRTVAARTFVVCTGGMEAARILLLSNLGGDAVGRYFQDHLSVRAAIAHPGDRRGFLELFEPWVRRGTQHMLRIEASRRLQEELGILNVLAHVVFEAEQGSGFDALRRGVRFLQSRGASERPEPRVLLRAGPEALRFAWSVGVRGRRPAPAGSRAYLTIDLEQAPNPESRITLADREDALGLRKGILDWRLTPLEGKTVRLFADRMNDEWERLGLGRLEWLPGVRADGDRWIEHMTDAFHHMGATRMGTDPATSVVDRDLKVHGVRNLYVASSSVFPTSGSSNPTLTLMALCLRLADHLAGLPQRT